LISQAVAAAGAGGSAPGRPGALPESLSQIHVRISHFERQSAREDTTMTEQRKQGRQGRARRGELKSASEEDEGSRGCLAVDGLFIG
jgi:hypothetical protein